MVSAIYFSLFDNYDKLWSEIMSVINHVLKIQISSHWPYNAVEDFVRPSRRLCSVWTMKQVHIIWNQQPKKPLFQYVPSPNFQIGLIFPIWKVIFKWLCDGRMDYEIQFLFQ